MLVALALAAALQSEPASALPVAPAEATTGVTSFPAVFFAPLQPTTALDMLERLPGLALDKGSSQRGFEGGGGNVLVDGLRPTSKTDTLEEILRRIPAGQVLRIDLIRGGAPGIDMQGKSVIANVIRSQTGGLQTMVSAGANRISADRWAQFFRLESNGTIGKKAWEVSARFGGWSEDDGDDGPHVRTGPTGNLISRSQIVSQTPNLNGSLTAAYQQPLMGGTFRINGRVFNEKKKTQEDDLFSFPVAALTQTDGLATGRDYELGGRYTRPIAEATTLELVGIRQTSDKTSDFLTRAPTSTDRFTLGRKTEETIGQAVIKRDLGRGMSAEVGVEGALNRLESQTRLVRNLIPVTLPAANVVVEETRTEAFAKSSWRPSDRLSLDGGLRFETSDLSSSGDLNLSKSLSYFKPRIGASWAASPTTEFRVRFERVVGQLKFDDFVAESAVNTGAVTAGNPAITPEQAWVAEAAIEQRFWKDGVITATVRHSALSDVIDRAPVFTTSGSFDAPANIGEGKKDELIVSLSLPLDRLGLERAQIKGQGTYRKSEVTDPTLGTLREISNLPPVEWDATFSQALPAWNSSWGIEAKSGARNSSYRFNEVFTTKQNTYVKAFYEWRASPDLSWRIEVQNMTQGGMRSTRTAYAGSRKTTGIAFVDDRDLAFGRTVFVRFRKTLGG